MRKYNSIFIHFNPKYSFFHIQLYRSDGEVYQLRVGKKPTKRGFMLFNDMLILGEKKSKKLTAKIVVDFDVATISDIPDNTQFGDEKIRDAWAVYDPTPIVLYAPDGADQKGALFNLMQSTLEGYKSDIIRRREKRANLVSSSFKSMK